MRMVVVDMGKKEEEQKEAKEQEKEETREKERKAKRTKLVYTKHHLE